MKEKNLQRLVGNVRIAMFLINAKRRIGTIARRSRIMKTLDEVIRWYENRKDTLIGKATREEMEDSVLHYLKEYRDAYGNVIASMNHHLRKIHELEQNDPLTWDELRQMVGKPVWVEGRSLDGDYKFWCIVGKTDVLDRYIHLREHGHNNWKDTYGDWWQAYRKER